MPRYFFTIFDGRGYVDTEGTELADLNVVQIYAIQYAGEVLLSEAQRIWPHSGWHLEVTDEDGCVILRLDFNVTPSPALTITQTAYAERALRRPDIW